MLGYFYYLIVFVLFCCIFFFKQKTAYEMRISDWSSDVCSSDLSGTSSADGLTLKRPRNGCANWKLTRKIIRSPFGTSSPNRDSLASAFQIGRASCRERVCQYV